MEHLVEHPWSTGPARAGMEEGCAYGGGGCWSPGEPSTQQWGTAMRARARGSLDGVSFGPHPQERDLAFPPPGVADTAPSTEANFARRAASVEEGCTYYGGDGGRPSLSSKDEAGRQWDMAMPMRGASLDGESYVPRAFPRLSPDAMASVWGGQGQGPRGLPSAGRERRRRRRQRYPRHWHTGDTPASNASELGHHSDFYYFSPADGRAGVYLMESELRGGPQSGPQSLQGLPGIAEGEGRQGARSHSYQRRISFQLDQVACGKGGLEPRDAGAVLQVRKAADESTSCPADATAPAIGRGPPAIQVPEPWGQEEGAKGPCAKESPWGEDGKLQGLNEDDLELHLLVQRLKLSCSIRDLAALRCEQFTSMLEASLRGSSARAEP